MLPGGSTSCGRRSVVSWLTEGVQWGRGEASSEWSGVSAVPMRSMMLRLPLLRLLPAGRGRRTCHGRDDAGRGCAAVVVWSLAAAGESSLGAAVVARPVAARPVAARPEKMVPQKLSAAAASNGLPITEVVPAREDEGERGGQPQAPALAAAALHEQCLSGVASGELALDWPLLPSPFPRRANEPCHRRCQIGSAHLGRVDCTPRLTAPASSLAPSRSQPMLDAESQASPCA